ncbi:MAG: hypothetical protein AAGA88_14480 [Pseudomonadota bacterium]
MLERIAPYQAHSGLATPAFSGDFGVTITPRMMVNLIQVQLWPGTAKQGAKALSSLVDPSVFETPGLVGVKANGDRVTGINIAPYRALLESESGDLHGRILAALGDAGITSDLTDARVAFALSGPKTRFVLSKAVNLDLDPSVFALSTAANTIIHHVPITLVRHAIDAFDIYAPSSFAESVLEWVLDAALEVGYRVDG